MVEAARSVYGATLPEDAVRAIEPWGKTDRRIAREMLRRAGVADAAIDAGMGDWEASAATLFERMAEAQAAGWSVRPGLAVGLDALRAGGAALAPLTGNLRAVARRKLELMGVDDRFDLARGAYGDDAEDRNELPAIARARAGAEREETWIVGDTEADLEAANAGGMRCALFTGPGLAPAVAARADAAVDSFDALAAVLLRPSG